MSRLGLWFDLKERGFKTTFERPGDSRSDCHAWGAHPIYHYYATILGVRPSRMGFGSVEVRPMLGGMKSASGKLVHPKGFIEVSYKQRAGSFEASITLPGGVSGVLAVGGTEEKLVPGLNRFDLPCSTPARK